MTIPTPWANFNENIFFPTLSDNIAYIVQTMGIKTIKKPYRARKGDKYSGFCRERTSAEAAFWSTITANVPIQIMIN